MRWAIILSLKCEAVSKARFAERTGVSLDQVFRPRIENLKKYGLVRETETEMALTKLGGFFADDVVETFSAPPYIPYPRSAYAEGPLNPYLDNQP